MGLYNVEMGLYNKGMALYNKGFFVGNSRDCSVDETGTVATVPYTFG